MVAPKFEVFVAALGSAFIRMAAVTVSAVAVKAGTIITLNEPSNAGMRATAAAAPAESPRDQLAKNIHTPNTNALMMRKPSLMMSSISIVSYCELLFCRAAKVTNGNTAR
jgi:hypothetical protein